MFLLRAVHTVVTYLHDNVDIPGGSGAKMKVVGSREFNQDVSAAKRLARLEPVFVTDRGRPTHVLMSIESFRRMSGRRESIVDLLALPTAHDVELAAPDRWDRPEPR
jgi:prevent-host-death family protein